MSDQFDQLRNKINWNSKQPHVLEIGSKDGKAVAKSEGKADIHISNNINAASIVRVSKIGYAQIDSSSNDLTINID